MFESAILNKKYYGTFFVDNRTRRIIMRILPTPVFFYIHFI